MDLQNNQKTISKMSVVNLYLFIIILNIKGLNSPIKDRVDKHIKNIYIYPKICCLHDRHILTVKAWKNIFQANGNQNKAGVAIHTHIYIYIRL